jgi:hypothetical protein
MQGGNCLLVGLDNDGNFVQIQNDDERIENFKIRLTLRNDLDGITIPGKATFGGVWPAATISEFKKLFGEIGRLGGSTDAVWTLPPEYFYPEIFLSQIQLIEELGGILLFNDSSFHIAVDDWDLSLLSKGNRKKIRQCQAQGVQFRPGNNDDLPQIYDLIRRNRISKGVTPSVSFDQLVTAARIFPNEYQFFALYLSDDLIASAVTVMITPDIRYVYMWADDDNFRLFSPVAMLCKEIVEDSRKNGIKIVDLGTASVAGVLDPGLARFKINLGAVQTKKPTFVIDFLS